ncbi:hypothetical protein HYH02_003770 [Chlamydomonas schloesseri]|uniref:Uncharacterized protein n=1 Tax=Chlamydomonas schloesseri TaxID=2026947 RepID=A0A836B8T9_9CHLO|nr:hypothetical protein HYH02_003770 [Chlamydomonas schloesseri]|eukprot:KAG2451162.1 hypothetical protein HYH02_003770 [Chlamydomonas schloesseri]
MLDSACSSIASAPAGKLQPGHGAKSEAHWAFATVVPALRKVAAQVHGADASAQVQSASGCEAVVPLPVPKRLDSTCSTASSATQPASPARPPRVPCKADYAWVRVIGAGSFGRVSLARELAGGRLVAIKTLNKVAVIRENQVQHVLDERAMLARVAGYPFLINLLASFQDTDNIYLVMDYVPGGEFFTHMRDNGPLHEMHARFYVAQIILALEHLHGKGIAYRDLKPENLLIGADGYVRLTDLGFAKVVKTRTYTLCGTPDYLAPEVIMNQGHTTAVDWWSLGCVVYEMLHGFPPFYTGQPQETYTRILARAFKFPSKFGPYAIDLIDKLLTVDPATRLGAGPEGVQAIKDHAWFTNLDWSLVVAKAYQPPHVPKLASDDDTRCFDSFEHLPPLDSGAHLTRPQQDWFRPFSLPPVR